MCALCGDAPETVLRLFVSCHMVKVLRFNNDWGFKPNELPLTSASQLVDWVTSPLNHSFGNWKERDKLLIFVAVVVDRVWGN